MKVSEFVAEARDELAMGWIKGQYVNDDGETCGVGALDRVACRHLAEPGIIATAAAAQNAVSATALEIYDHSNIPTVNDHLAGSKQAMLDLYDKTVIGLEEQGK